MIEIYFDDLNEEAQERIVEQGYDPGNSENCPLVIFELEEDEK